MTAEISIGDTLVNFWNSSLVKEHSSSFPNFSICEWVDKLPYMYAVF